MTNLPLFARTHFSSRTTEVLFNGKKFVVNVETDKKSNKGGSHRYCYHLFDEGKQVSVCHVSLISSARDYRHDYLTESMKILPNSCLEIISINSEILEKVSDKQAGNLVSYKGMGYGSFLLNFVIGDLNEYSAYVGKNFPIIFDMIDSPANLAFYSKFNAEANMQVKVDKSLTPMIIANPCQIKDFTGEIVSQKYNQPVYISQLQ